MPTKVQRTVNRHIVQVYVQTLKDAPRPCCRQDCGPKEAFFLKVKADSAVTAGRKSYCTKEGCSSDAFVSNKVRKCTFLQPFLWCVSARLHEVLVWRFFLKLIWPASSPCSFHSHVPCVTNSCYTLARWCHPLGLLKLSRLVGVTFIAGFAGIFVR